MEYEVIRKQCNKILEKAFPQAHLYVKVKHHTIFVKGELEKWQDIVKACQLCVQKNTSYHVVNDLVWIGGSQPEMSLPDDFSERLEGRHVDVLIIGGGISGASIARELSQYQISVMLVEKETDLAMHASGKNDGEIHPGIDLPKGSIKQSYVVKGNRLYDQICEELNVPFVRRGQFVCFTQAWLKPLVQIFCQQRIRVCGVDDTKIVSGSFARKKEPSISKDVKFAIYNPMAGCVSPFGLTIAYAENAVENGVDVQLNTAVLDIQVEKHEIVSVLTNHGRIYPKIVINAAGTFTEEIAKMAQDRFYSIHPRKGTDAILDRNASEFFDSIAATKKVSMKKTVGHTKGGAIIKTVDDNILVGPNAIETPEKENFGTELSSLKEVFDKHALTVPGLTMKDVIAYFTGVRAATFEEDYILEWGRNTHNLYHVAGIQSPGLTTAPAVAKDVTKQVINYLRTKRDVQKNPTYNPYRKRYPIVRFMPPKEKHELIQQNPNYGITICRCEEISKGEIIDALHAPICVPTIDGIKRRVRPGSGRCQGGFCMPLVAQIIAEQCHKEIRQIDKGKQHSFLTFGSKKGVES